MGNCFSLKHKKNDFDRGHPTVSRWLASCDFSSVPDIEDFSSEAVEEHSQSCVIYTSVLGGEHLEGDFEGYTTAVENLESEGGDGSGDTVEELAPSSCNSDQQVRDLHMQVDDESVYETSDEQGPYEVDPRPEISQEPGLTEDKYIEIQGEEGDDIVQEEQELELTEDKFVEIQEEEEEDVVDELGEWKTNYDARPICPLPTPLRKNLVCPRINLESLVDRKGRVRRSERVQLYLDEMRQLTQRL